MKFKTSLLVLACCAGLLYFPGCYYDNNEELHPELLLNNGSCDTTVVIRYSADIQPILNSSCGANNSCHNASTTSGVLLNSYNGVKSVANDGRLWSAVIWDGNASFMPQASSSKINDCYLAKIRKWLDEGAPNN